MKCQNCGYENPEGSKFCTSCGKELKKETIDIVTQEVQKPKPKENKKKLIIVVSIIVVLSLCITAFFLLKPASVSAEYKEAIQTGQKYLDAHEYEKAEDAFLLAQSIEPKISEPYVKLYEVYKKTDQPKKMEVIKQEVETQLPEKEQEIFEDQKEEINNKMEDTAYTVLDTKVPDFEITPIDNISHEGYTIKEDGKYGFIDSNLKYIMEPKYESVMMMPGGNSNMNISKLYVCMFPDKKEDGVQNGVPLANEFFGKTDADQCGYGFGGVGTGIYLDSDFNVITGDIVNQELIYLDSLHYSLALQKINGDITDFESFLNNRNDNTDRNSYYVVTPTLDIYGPYDIKEHASFITDFDSLETDKELQLYSGWSERSVQGVFYEKTEKGYRIWNEDGTKSTTTFFDKATPISDNAMKVEKNGKMGVINADLELVLFGDFEDVTLPINNKAFVKMDGKWKQIQIKKDSTSNLNVFKEISSVFVTLNGRGIPYSDLTIMEDGKFTVNFNLSSNERNSEYPNGTIYRLNATGKLSPPKYINDYTYSTKVEKFNLEREIGTEYIEDGTRIIISEFPELNKNDELIIYKSGIPLSKVPSECLNTLVFPFLKDNRTDVLQKCIICNKNESGYYFDDQ